MLQTVINKTRKMRNITIEKTLRFKDKKEGDLLAEIFLNETNVHKLEARLKAPTEFFARHEVDLLEILHEDHPKRRKVNQKQDISLKSSQLPVLHGKTQTIRSKTIQDGVESKHREYNKLKKEHLVTPQYRECHAKQDKKRIKEVDDSYFEEIELHGRIASEGLAQAVKTPEQVSSYPGDTAKYAQTQVHAQSIPAPLHALPNGPKRYSFSTPLLCIESQICSY